MKSDDFHIEFKINNTSFESKRELLKFSESFSNGVYIFLIAWFDDNNYVEVQTSGSTGKPKKIRLKKKHMINSARATGQFFQLPEKSNALLCLSIDFIAGKMMLLRAMILGWHLDIVEASSHPLVNSNKNYDFCAMIPMQLYNSINKIQLINQLIVGGGAINNEYLPILNGLSTKIFATYGMTETITHIAVKKLNNCSIDENGSETPFLILPNIKISKNSDDCLVIDAPKIADEIIKTNDLIELISDTKFHWLGRKDNIINSGGVKLIPELIEQKLSKVIGHPFFVIGISDTILGEKLVLVIESMISDDTLIDQVKKIKTLNQYELPKEIYFLENFRRTESKKINRKETLQYILESKRKS